MGKKSQKFTPALPMGIYFAYSPHTFAANNFINPIKTRRRNEQQ
jgi:hypothetical protein